MSSQLLAHSTKGIKGARGLCTKLSVQFVSVALQRNIGIAPARRGPARHVDPHKSLQAELLVLEHVDQFVKEERKPFSLRHGRDLRDQNRVDERDSRHSSE